MSFGDGHSLEWPKYGRSFVRAVRVWRDSSVDGEALEDARTRHPTANGDVNASGAIDLSDAIYLLGWLFRGTAPPVGIVCPARGGGPLPATGQTKCYDDIGEEIACDSVDFPGQDAYYALGCPSQDRFIDNGDGTVLDLCTGLVWQQETADTNRDGAVTGEDQVNWQRALRYCEQLESAGYSDWRLPNVTELRSIVGFGRTNPAINTAFRITIGTAEQLSGMYWTSTTHLRTPDDAWTISFFNGELTDSQKQIAATDNNVQFVLAVRGGL